MNDEQFARELDRIAREYNELTLALIESKKRNQQQIYEAKNAELNRDLLNAFLLHTGVLISTTYLLKSDDVNRQLSRMGTAPREDFTQYIEDPLESPYGTEIRADIEDAAEPLRDMARSSRLYKTQLGQQIIRAKETLDRTIRRSRRNIREGVTAGRAFRDIQEEAERIFRETTQGIQEASNVMFVDAGGRSWTYQRYAGVQTTAVAGETELDAISDQMVRAGSDIVQVPFTSTTEDACLPFQRKYVSVSGQNAGKMFRGQALLSLPEMRLPNSGIFHPYCTHFGLIPVALTEEEQIRLAV